MGVKLSWLAIVKQDALSRDESGVCDQRQPSPQHTAWVTEDHAPLSGADLNKGTPVMYTGPDNPRLISPHAAFAVLRKGHPGRILDPDWHHIRVEWVRLEDEPISYGAGFCLERTADQPDGFVPGLVRISESSYEDLAKQFRSEADQQ